MSAPVARSLSTSSTDTAATNIPFMKRRMSPEQLQALHSLYEFKSHPSKEERADLAHELNLELKAVNVWFQNKRRSMKKKSIAWNRATALMSENVFGLGGRHSGTPANPSKQRSFLRRNSSISLDSIVSSREKKESLALLRPPLTPRKNTLPHKSAFPVRQQSSGNEGENPCLWDHLLSSPQLPPSSPTKETDMLSNLPPQSKALKSLEWACARDRVDRKKKKESKDIVEEHPEVPELDLDSILDDDSDLDEDENMITPDTSISLSSIEVHTHRRNKSFDGKGAMDTETPAEDVEAAMALLGFKVHNS
ncbi:hypothetical protein BDW22DRAFT_1349867 [Trametopsis cervina]|nr:hypothetical protein BDW22DRAFT_1349867 [Trametopsis cervina]